MIERRLVVRSAFQRGWQVRGTTMFVAARWGLIPYWNKDPKGGHQPINARSEEVKTKASFKAAYERRRALMPIDGFF